MKQTAITRSARGQPCTLRLDKCESGGENLTTIFAHKNGAGLGLKSKDADGKDVGFYSCFYCHQTYDGQIPHPYYTKKFMGELVEYAISETRTKLKKKGLI